ncbi:MAG TPA: hypothetical protein VIQ24_02055 [Pyrinomonadaceae bacterium]
MSAKKPLILFSLLLMVAAVTATAGLRGQKQNNSTSPALEKAKEDFYAVTDYTAPEPIDPQKRELRRARNARYNMRPEKGVDPKLFKLTEERESSFGGPPSHAPVEPSLPAAQSDAVIIGEVSDAQAYLTEDKTGIYSEFTVRVGEVLKNSTTTPLGSDSSISAIRGGGAVRFPSGKVIRYGQHGKPLPRTGRRYVFFLKYNNDEGQDFKIITAYELRDGQVFPLDGLNLVGRVETAYAAYQKHRGAVEAVFLDEVRDAIARNPGGEAKRREALR